ncbi:hypothetical protein WMY93_020556 [Mugilogobius chulae]|uniref:Plexin cytoplasmic RasGAP domain-containing protein n=1 Tax=Mugilogobius chulae TaxID=88201 RepID=A0AAW0NE01_9GOBI
MCDDLLVFQVLPHDELMETRKKHRQSHHKKVLPEIYLTRLLSTKGTLQKFLDDLFQAILSIPPDRPPLAVKYFFDFLEEQADKRGITDPDTLHIWKTNRYNFKLNILCRLFTSSLLVNILKNPQFVFDIDKTDHMDACLSVIAQAFIDACSISDLQLGKSTDPRSWAHGDRFCAYVCVCLSLCAAECQCPLLLTNPTHSSNTVTLRHWLCTPAFFPRESTQPRSSFTRTLSELVSLGVMSQKVQHGRSSNSH